MPKEDHIHIEGKVTAASGGGHYQVLLENNVTVLAKLSGKMKRFKIRIIIGDKVTVALSPYDPSHGFITHRQRL